MEERASVAPGTGSMYRIPKPVLDLFSNEARIIVDLSTKGLIWIDPVLLGEKGQALGQNFDIIAIPKGTIRG